MKEITFEVDVGNDEDGNILGDIYGLLELCVVEFA